MKEENPWIVSGIKRRTHAHSRTMYQMIAELDTGASMPNTSTTGSWCILSGRMKLIVEGVPRAKTGDSPLPRE